MSDEQNPAADPAAPTPPDVEPTTGEPVDPDDLAPEVVRERIVRLAFGGDHERYEQFVDGLREVIPPDVKVVLRGSAVTGKRWADGRPFDDEGPGTSDIDLTLVGRDMVKLFREYYIPALHSVPLSEQYPEVSPVLVPLRRALTTLAGRPVNIQATTDFVQYLRDLVLDQPFFELIAEGEGRGPTPDDDEPTSDVGRETTDADAVVRRPTSDVDDPLP